MNAEERIALLARHLVDRGAHEVVLFGSRARKEARRGSDIDLAVRFDPPLDFREKRRLREHLDTLAGLYSVDLVFLDEIDSRLRHIIEQEGKPLHVREPDPATH